MNPVIMSNRLCRPNNLINRRKLVEHLRGQVVFSLYILIILYVLIQYNRNFRLWLSLRTAAAILENCSPIYLCTLVLRIIMFGNQDQQNCKHVHCILTKADNNHLN